MSARKVSKWMGEYGAYDVPEAIVNLGEAANRSAGLPSQEHLHYPEMFESPCFKTIAEWGAWRDEQEAKRAA